MSDVGQREIATQRRVHLHLGVYPPNGARSRSRADATIR